MKKADVKLGSTYRVKVSGRIAEVKITGENPHGGWDGVNAATNRTVRIKSAQRLRGLAQRPKKRKVVTSAAEALAGKSDAAKTVEAVEKGNLAEGITVPTIAQDGPRAKTAAKAKPKAKAAAKRDTGKPRGHTAGRFSGLDAAAVVLEEAGEPLNAKQIVEQMLAKRLWTTNGRTPAATVYAAMHRECAAKGGASRFHKVGRGKFELAK